MVHPTILGNGGNFAVSVSVCLLHGWAVLCSEIRHCAKRQNVN